MLGSTWNLVANTSRSSMKLVGHAAASGGKSMVAKATGSNSKAAPSLKPLPKASSTASSSRRPRRFTPPMDVIVTPAVMCGCPGFLSTRSTRMPQQLGLSSKPAPCSGCTRMYGPLLFPFPTPFCDGSSCAGGSSRGGRPQSELSGASGATPQSSASPEAVEAPASDSSRARPAYFGPVVCASADQLFPFAFFFGSALCPSSAEGFLGAA
mmetsp:Transcript_50981/g.143288  ORF Transcript_50981/g.143288 Transcript_50981/m.143288 type:complete len:210 (-) Transcript_50981:2517-3146(-)